MKIAYFDPDDLKISGLSPREVAVEATDLLRLVYRERYYDPGLWTDGFVAYLEKKIKTRDSKRDNVFISISLLFC